METKKCSLCGEVKAHSEFGRNRSRPDGLSFYCLACNRVKSKATYARARAALGREVQPRESLPEGMKRCGRCREIKAVTEFHKQRSQAGGYHTYCKPCRKTVGSALYFHRTYGLTRLELNVLVEIQGGLCAICQVNPAEHVDHCHDSGKIRGVLCFTCNVALGHLKDDVQLFRRGIDYLERTTWQRT